MKGTKEPQREFKVLALSGGGYRGLYTAQVLNKLEKHYGFPLAHHFDLITGTSIGGIIALALAKEVSTSTILETFKNHQSDIFTKNHFNTIQLARSKYTSKGLKKLFSKKELLGSTLMGELKNRVVIPAVNTTTGTFRIFRSPPTNPCQVDSKIPLLDIALATSAAPTYFPAHKIDNMTYIDGGLFANAPGLIGMHEVKHFISKHENYSYQDSEIRLLSISTLGDRYTLPKNNAGRNFFNGGMYWGKKLPQLMISAQELHTNHILKHQLNEENYVHLSEELSEGDKATVGLDKTNKNAQAVLVGKASTTFQKCLDNKHLHAFFTTPGDQ